MIKIGFKITDKTKAQRERLENFSANMVRHGSVNVRKLLIDHWMAKDRSEPNKLNPSRRTHFWQTIAQSLDSVKTFRTEGRAEIAHYDPRLMHKITGGRIIPRLKKALTIPIHPAAYAIRASALAIFEGVKLFVLRSKSGHAFLAARKGKVLVRYYLLKYAVTQGPWPRTIPTHRQIKSAFIRGATEAR
jgi:hypothetical protein